MMIPVKDIKAIIEPYRYGQFNIPHKTQPRILSYRDDFEMFGSQISGSEEKLWISPYYRHDEFPTQGTCCELMLTARRDIKEAYPNIHIIRATGQDPGFFSEPGDAHFFLLLLEHNIMGESPYIVRCNPHVGRCMDEILVAHNPLVVDPSLGRIGRYKDSGYKVIAMFSEDFNEPYHNHLIMANNGAVPIFMVDDELVFLVTDFTSQSKLGMGFTRIGNPIEKHDLHSSELTKRIKGHRHLEDFVAYFRNLRFKD